MNDFGNAVVLSLSDGEKRVLWGNIDYDFMRP